VTKKNWRGLRRKFLRASLETSISQGISIFSWENELISNGKIEILWKIRVPKLAFTKDFSLPLDYS
jgi:hypothetical protein